MPSADDFDFWLGSWVVRWGETGEETGSNVITRSFGGRVVEERFDGRPGVDLLGMSVSAFDEHRGLWRQTWVDDGGNYFALEGGLDDGVMTLLTTAHNAPRPDTVFRMRFFDIALDALTWTWERSLDAGVTFEERWRLGYVRA